MNRLTVLQKIINKINAKTYLEIGVEKGKIISKIKAPYKIGVDPKFIFSFSVQLKRIFRLTKFKAIETTSNTFFQRDAPKLLPNGVDVAFVDGLHTYQQSLQDIEYCLQYLNPNGFIIVHDCNPLNAAIAWPVKESIQEVITLANKGEVAGWNGAWTGDIWKAIAHLRIKHNDLEIFTLDLDWGLGIIRKGKNSQLQGFDVDQIQKADYSFFQENREILLNLKHPKFLDEFLSQLC